MVNVLSAIGVKNAYIFQTTNPDRVFKPSGCRMINSTR
jgi:hypothetical protein